MPAKTRTDLLREVAALRARVQHAEDTLDAIRRGEVDAIVTDGPAGEQIFTLQTAERPYRLIVEEMQEGAVTVAPDGTVLYCNRSFARMLQRNPGKLLGSSIYDYLYPPDLSLMRGLLWDATPGVPRRGELHWLAADGHRIPAYVGANSLMIDALASVSLVVLDLSEQRRQQHALGLLQALAMAISTAQDFESALSSVLRHVCHATGWTLGEAWLPRADGVGLERSPAWYCGAANVQEMLQEHTEQVTCLPGIGLIGRVWASKKAAWMRDLRFESQPGSAAGPLGLNAAVAIPVLARDEAMAVIAFYMEVPRDEDAQLMELISTVAAQLGPMIQRKQLEDAHALLASIVESMQEAIVSTTLDGVVLSWNAAAERFYGYRPNDIKGRRMNVLLYPDGIAEMNRILDEVRQGQRVARHTHIVRARGDHVPAYVTVSPIRRGAGEIVGAAFHIGKPQLPVAVKPAGGIAPATGKRARA